MTSTAITEAPHHTTTARNTPPRQGHYHENRHVNVRVGPSPGSALLKRLRMPCFYAKRWRCARRSRARKVRASSFSLKHTLAPLRLCANSAHYSPGPGVACPSRAAAPATQDSRCAAALKYREETVPRASWCAPRSSTCAVAPCLSSSLITSCELQGKVEVGPLRARLGPWRRASATGGHVYESPSLHRFIKSPSAASQTFAVPRLASRLVHYNYNCPRLGLGGGDPGAVELP